MGGGRREAAKWAKTNKENRKTTTTTKTAQCNGLLARRQGDDTSGFRAHATKLNPPPDDALKNRTAVESHGRQSFQRQGRIVVLGRKVGKDRRRSCLLSLEARRFQNNFFFFFLLSQRYLQSIMNEKSSLLKQQGKFTIIVPSVFILLPNTTKLFGDDWVCFSIFIDSSRVL